MDTKNEKILFVDDNVNLLAGLERQFRKRYDVTTAEGGEAGIEAINNSGPFSVIVCDMKMPDMNGIQFFTKAQEIARDSTRIMLTGNADLETAMHAVNEGNIFRFLMKPCEKSTIEWAVDSGIEYYNLKKLEKDLLENTLQGCVKALMDMLALTNPLAFSKTARIKRYVRQVGKALKVPAIWKLELAASLSQIGCVTVPSDTLEKVAAGDDLTEQEVQMYQGHPALGQKIISAIPRLEDVGAIIGAQFSATELIKKAPGDELCLSGELILALALEIDNLVSRGESKNQALTAIKKKYAELPEEIITAFKNVEFADVKIQTRVVRISELTSAMTLADDLRSRNGTLIASKGQEVNNAVKALLSNYAQRQEIEDHLRVKFRALTGP